MPAKTLITTTKAEKTLLGPFKKCQNHVKKASRSTRSFRLKFMSIAQIRKSCRKTSKVYALAFPQSPDCTCINPIRPAPRLLASFCLDECGGMFAAACASWFRPLHSHPAVFPLTAAPAARIAEGTHVSFQGQ